METFIVSKKENMIGSFFHNGSGLGDQLFRFVTSKTLAQKKGSIHGMVNPSNFKGSDFMKIPLEYGMNVDSSFSFWIENEIRDENGVDRRSYDPEINFVEDNTIIDGSFEDDKYWRHNLKNINEWLKVEPLKVPDDLCIIGFRGGEYATQPDLFLPVSYYAEAMLKIGDKNYEVHTDDPELARKILGLPTVKNNPISHSKHANMGFNWRSARFAKYAIIPNSAFFIIPRILKHQEDPEAVTIAPRYWARRNTNVWARPACYYPEFLYV